MNNGGPAFPAPAGVAHITEQGMTLRDYFAAKAMQGILAGWTINSLPPSDMLSNAAYEYADYMLQKRKLND